jgi:hypothetical protein
MSKAERTAYDKLYYLKNKLKKQAQYLENKELLKQKREAKKEKKALYDVHYRY